MVIPENKQQLIDETKKLITDYENQYSEGLITRGEKYNKVVDVVQILLIGSFRNDERISADNR